MELHSDKTCFIVSSCKQIQVYRERKHEEVRQKEREQRQRLAELKAQLSKQAEFDVQRIAYREKQRREKLIQKQEEEEKKRRKEAEKEKQLDLIRQQVKFT